jgi:hypothetical protein
MSEWQSGEQKWVAKAYKAEERNRILRLLTKKLQQNEELTHAEIIELIASEVPKSQTGRGQL